MKMRLKELRLKNKLLQRNVAEVLNCSQAVYSRYENGEREMPKEYLSRLADFYSVSVDYLLGRDQQRETAFSSPKQQQIFSELGNLSEEQLEEVLRYAEYVKQKK